MDIFSPCVIATCHLAGGAAPACSKMAPALDASAEETQVVESAALDEIAFVFCMQHKHVVLSG